MLASSLASLRTTASFTRSFRKSAIASHPRTPRIASINTFQTRKVSSFQLKSPVLPPLQSSSSAFSRQRHIDSASRGKRTVFIQTETTPNPDSLKFYPTGHQILAEGAGTKDFPTLASASSSPLAKRLFRIEGVKGVFLSSAFLTVNKEPEVSWHLLKPLIFTAVIDHFTSGEPTIQESAEGGKTGSVELPIKPEDADTVNMIKEIIETRIRPAVQEDGGDVEFRGYDSGVVFLKMQGSCSTCPSSSATLKGGIERMLMHWVPDVTNVVAMEDDDLKRIAQEQFEATEKRIQEEKQQAKAASA